MKNLNHKHQKAPVSRDDIARYQRGAMPSDETEEFDKEALEGWKKTGSSLSLMHQMDRKYLSSSALAAVIVSVSVLLIVGTLWFLNAEQTPEQVQSAQVKTYIEKEDVKIPTSIEELEMVSDRQMIKPKEIKRNFELKKAEENKQENASNQPEEELNVLPKQDLEVVEKPIELVTRNRKLAKEMYSNSLKLIDYREYRSRPSIKTEQRLLTGTPADMENQGSASEEFEWKTVDIPYHDYIVKTMGIFNKGNYKKALSRFEEILKTYPDDLNANFYGALCYFNLGDYSKAAQAFEQCMGHEFSNFYEEAEWYLAKSYLNNGKTSEGKVLLKKIADGKGFYANQAKKELD